tara:strand:- start:5091 stop:5525 length:435 start_codon:yes stop_codon:yes gene_type:complete
MGNLQRYQAADLPQLFDRITRNAIGMDDYFDRIFTLNESVSNYPPFNLVQVNNVESRLEIALAGFKNEEVKVYTEFGKLFIEGKKEEEESQKTYAHRGIAQRSFIRSWTLSDDTEIRSVTFEDGLLTVDLGKVVPDHHLRKEWF